MAWQKIKKVTLKLFFICLLIFVFGVSVGYFLHSFQEKLPFLKREEKKDPYLTFISEVYDLIEQNYWQKISDEELSSLFQLGAEKITSKPQIKETKNKEELLKLLKEIKNEMSEEEKKEFSINLADIVLANLQPFGRSRLYTTREEEDLKNLVQNINPEIDLYEILGVEKEASQEELEEAYSQKKKRLEESDLPEAEVELEETSYAFNVLKDRQTRGIYDQSGVEPTIEGKLLTPEIFHLWIKKFSPTTYDDLKRMTEGVDQGEKLNTLILDLRDNVGGAIDGLPYFLGPFIGQDQYAYQFFHQGEKEDLKTQTGWLPSLVRYKKVVILVNNQTQSSAEVMASVLKKYNVGVLVGSPTKGWGTVEKVFPLKTQLDSNQKYSVFLAHSLTLRDDGQPIEGNGVEPQINIKDASWEEQLFAYFHHPDLIEAVKSIIEKD